MGGFLPLADIELIPLAGILVGFGLLVVIPVVAILTEHQRKMARIMHGQVENEDPSTVVIGVAGHLKDKNADKAVLDELRALRSEVADLRMHVASLGPSSRPPIDSVQSRLSQGSEN